MSKQLLKMMKINEMLEVRNFLFSRIRDLVNSLLASDHFSHLLIAFANSLDPDQDRHLNQTV